MSAIPSEPDVALICPMCEYDLRGQIEPRCPECGYRFEWEELRDPARQLHPYLFEHHPERNLRAFVRTHLGGWEPKRFWRTLAPTQPSRGKRLLAYHLLIAALIVLPTAGLVARRVYLLDSANRATQVTWLASGGPRISPPVGMTIQQAAAQYFPTFPSDAFFTHLRRDRHIRLLLLAQGLTLAWPWLTIAALLIFQVSMSRRRIRAIHMARCVVYSSDLLLVTAALTLGFVLFELYGVMISSGTIPWVSDPGRTLACVAILALPLFCYRLWMAIEHYLRFDHPLATMLAVQTIVLLVAAIVIIHECFIYL